MYIDTEVRLFALTDHQKMKALPKSSRGIHHVLPDEDLDKDIAFVKYQGHWNVQTHDDEIIHLNTGKVILDRVERYKDGKVCATFTISNPKVCDKVTRIDSAAREWALSELLGKVHSNLMLTKRTLDALLGASPASDPTTGMKCGIAPGKCMVVTSEGVTVGEDFESLTGQRAYLSIEPSFIWLMNEDAQEKRMGLKWYIRAIRLDDSYVANAMDDSWSL